MIWRTANVDDAQALADLHKAAFEKPWSPEEFASWATNPQMICILACTEEANTPPNIQGFCLAQKSGDDAEILTITVAQEVRQTGIARKTLKEMAKIGSQQGITDCVLEVEETNTPALLLYKSLGFVEIGRRKGYYATREGVADALVLRAPLSSMGGHRAD